MRTQIEIDNVNLNTTNFLKWIGSHPDKESNYLNNAEHILHPNEVWVE